MLTSPSILLLLLACGPSEPVLSGIGSGAVLQDGSGEAMGSSKVEAYKRPAGVVVDVRHLGGRSFSSSRDVVADQLGTLLASRELAGADGRELEFQHATLRVADDLIYMISVPLAEPLGRTQALAAVGFPPATKDYIVLHREYRLNHERGFRRLRFKRVSTEVDLVTEVEAWRWVPGERSNRR